MGNQITSAYVTADPGILGGKPIIAGTRISVQLVLEKLRDGWTIDDLLDDYPQLTREQIEAALRYSASCNELCDRHSSVVSHGVITG